MKRGLFYLLILISATNSYANNDLLTGLIHYQTIEQPSLINETFKSKGSSRIAPIMEQLLADFSRFYPKTRFEIESGGSGTAIDALIAQSAHFGLMSRKIKATEINRFIDAKGYRPTEVRIALDDLHVIVNRKNPLDSLSLQELDAIFSSNRECGASYSINNWEEFGWVAKKAMPSTIDTYIFNKTSGARGFFSSVALCNGHYKVSSHEVSETKHDMLEAIANSITGIGFSALTIDDYRVKTLKIAKQRLYPAYKPTLNNVLSNDYPLSRYLYIYVDKPPNSEMPLAYREFFKFLFSHQGQQIILNYGAIPLRFNVIRDQLVTIIK